MSRDERKLVTGSSSKRLHGHGSVSPKGIASRLGDLTGVSSKPELILSPGHSDESKNSVETALKSFESGLETAPAFGRFVDNYFEAMVWPVVREAGRRVSGKQPSSRNGTAGRCWS